MGIPYLLSYTQQQKLQQQQLQQQQITLTSTPPPATTSAPLPPILPTLHLDYPSIYRYIHHQNPSHLLLSTVLSPQHYSKVVIHQEGYACREKLITQIQRSANTDMTQVSCRDLPKLPRRPMEECCMLC